MYSVYSKPLIQTAGWPISSHDQGGAFGVDRGGLCVFCIYVFYVRYVTKKGEKKKRKIRETPQASH